MFATEVLEQLADLAARADVVGTSDDELIARLLELARAEALLSTAKGHALAELDARGTTDREHGMRTAPWLAKESSIPPGAARRELRTARKLRETFRRIDDAVVADRLSAHHADALVDMSNPRVEQQLVERQDELIELAQDRHFEQWRREVKALINELDQDGGYDPNLDPDSSHLAVSRTIDGRVQINGALYGEDGLAVLHTLETKVNEIVRRQKADNETCADVPVLSRRQLNAKAIVELLYDALAVDKRSSRPPNADVTLVVEADNMSVAYTPVGEQLAMATLRRWLCGASWFPIVVNSKGVPLDAGREIRHANRAQRRAMERRDGGCVFPHCDCKASWTEAHHTRAWILGGETDVAKMASLCRFHHGVVHRKGWKMSVTEDQWFVFESPSGERFWSQRHGTRRTDAIPEELFTLRAERGTHDAGAREPLRC